MHTLEADGIQLEFDGRKVLSDIYIKLQSGTITGLLGKNGAGKSSLMKVIYGTLSCEKSVRIDNVSRVHAYQNLRLLRYLPQFNFIPKTRSLKSIFHDFQLNFSLFVQDFPGYEHSYKKQIGALSGGERRLVELYVVVKPPTCFVMLDEPFTHLSPLQIENVKKLLKEEKRTKGILLTDHLFKDVVEVSDAFYILANRKTYLAKTITDIERLNYARL